MNRLTHIALALFVTIMAMTACTDGSCYDNGSSLPLATLHVGATQTTVPGLTIKGIGAPGDSLLADNSALNEVYLPLRASVSTTSFAVTRQVSIQGENAVVNDTLTIDYEPIAYFHSKECGAMFNFNIKRINHTENGIDSVVLLTPLVTNSNVPALRIHFTDFQS